MHYLPRPVHGLLLAALLLAVAPLLNGCDAADPDAATDAWSFVAEGSAASSMTKSELCHRTSSDTNDYVLITVADAAYDTHVAHGDASPGDPVPNRSGFEFDDACAVVPSASCPCFDAADLDAFDTSDYIYTNLDNVVSLLSADDTEEASVYRFDAFQPYQCQLRDVSLEKYNTAFDLSNDEAASCSRLITEEAESRELLP